MKDYLNNVELAIIKTVFVIGGTGLLAIFFGFGYFFLGA